MPVLKTKIWSSCERCHHRSYSFQTIRPDRDCFQTLSNWFLLWTANSPTKPEAHWRLRLMRCSSPRSQALSRPIFPQEGGSRVGPVSTDGTHRGWHAILSLCVFLSSYHTLPHTFPGPSLGACKCPMVNLASPASACGSAQNGQQSVGWEQCVQRRDSHEVYWHLPCDQTMCLVHLHESPPLFSRTMLPNPLQKPDIQ